jgi:hypothetical protein
LKVQALLMQLCVHCSLGDIRRRFCCQGYVHHPITHALGNNGLGGTHEPTSNSFMWSVYLAKDVFKYCSCFVSYPALTRMCYDRQPFPSQPFSSFDQSSPQPGRSSHVDSEHLHLPERVLWAVWAGNAPLSRQIRKVHEKA